MKTTPLPSLLVEPEFRDVPQSTLKEGEALWAFMENAIRRQVRKRQVDAQYQAHGLKA